MSLYSAAAEVVGSVQEKSARTSTHIIRYQLANCLDSSATLGTSCWAPFARHLFPDTSHQAPLAGLTIIPCCKYFFSVQTVAAAAVEVNDRA